MTCLRLALLICAIVSVFTVGAVPRPGYSQGSDGIWRPSGDPRRG